MATLAFDSLKYARRLKEAGGPAYRCRNRKRRCRLS